MKVDSNHRTVVAGRVVDIELLEVGKKILQKRLMA